MDTKFLLEIGAILGVIETILLLIERVIKLLERAQKLERKKLRSSLFLLMGIVGSVLLSILTFWVVHEVAPTPIHRCEHVDYTVVKQPGMKNILPIVVLEVRQIPPVRDFTTENHIRHVIADHGFYPQGNFFRECFFEEGHFLDIFDGRSQRLIELQIHKLVDYLMLAEISKEFSKSETTEVITCNVDLTYKILDSSGQLVKSGTVSAAGPGFSKAAAEKKAIEKIADKMGKVI